MKRQLCLILSVLLLVVLFSACWPQENPPTVHVVHNGQLYELPTETAAYDDLDETKLVEAKIISFDVLPANEGEVNVNAQSVRLYDLDEKTFLVIIDGKQYPVTVR